MRKIINKMKWAIPIFLFGIIFSIPKLKVKALTSDTFYYEWINPKIYVSKTKNNVERSELVQVYHRSSDGAIVYCIEPGVDFSSTNTITGYDNNQASITGMTQDEWNRINLIAYYGYGYGNHTDPKWYAITQYEIWKAYPLGWDTYWVDSFHGNRISQFESESNELLNLVNNHYKRPSFNNQTITGVVNDEIMLTDTNGVLNNYEVNISNNASFRKDGNNLYVKLNEVGNVDISFSKNSARFGRTSIAYVASGVQNLLLAGNLDPVFANVKINSIGGKVTINKIDKDTLKMTPQGDALLKGAIYGVYLNDGTKITTITTNDNGVATSVILPKQGKYYLQEEKASIGYELDDTKYYFDITKDNLYPIVTTYEKVIERDVKIFKVFASDKTGILTGEKNISFDVYLKSNNKKIDTITTDNKGLATIKLPYGTYILKQINSTENYYKVDDFEIVINENTDEVYYKLLSNSEIKAKLKLVKKDLDSDKVLPIKGIKFKLFDVNNNEYVCQNITYPTKKQVCIYETDNNGEFITPYELKSGTYLIEELDQKIDGYLWNKDSTQFEIGENSKLIYDEDFGVIHMVEFFNKQVKGEIIINKTKEKLVINDGSYNYEIENLEGAVFNIYANSDIISKDGVKHYNKGDLVGTITTDKNGIGKLSDLYLGKYYYQEISVPDENIVIDNNKYEFELTYNDQYTSVVSKSFDILNKYKKGTLEFTKTDLSTGKVLPNTLIEIYTINDELIFSGRTDDNGKIIITDLPIGKYFMLEKEAPEGYILNEGKVEFEIKENGQIVKANMTNQSVIVPNTGLNESKVLNVVGVVLTLLGIIYLVYDKKKRK